MLRLYRKKQSFDIVVYMGGYRCKVEYKYQYLESQ